MFLCFIFFFFSSRRRHTRCLSDWSSDVCSSDLCRRAAAPTVRPARTRMCWPRSEEHTSELQSLRHLVCRLLLEKKKKKIKQQLIKKKNKKKKKKKKKKKQK